MNGELNAMNIGNELNQHTNTLSLNMNSWLKKRRIIIGKKMLQLKNGKYVIPKPIMVYTSS